MEHEVRTTATSNQTRKGIDLELFYQCMTPIEVLEYLFHNRCSAVVRLGSDSQKEINSNIGDSILFEEVIKQVKMDLAIAKSGN